MAVCRARSANCANFYKDLVQHTEIFMKKLDTVRALRDAEYRNSLSDEELALLPAHPAGASSLADTALKSVVGGCGVTACSNCGPTRGTTILFSCVPPGSACP